MLCSRAHRQEKALSEREKDELRTAREHDRYAREEAFQVTPLASAAFGTIQVRPLRPLCVCAWFMHAMHSRGGK